MARSLPNPRSRVALAVARGYFAADVELAPTFESMSAHSATRPVRSKLSTGVAGLDEVLHGGLIVGGFYLLQGDPGSGKTTIALQFAMARARDKEKVLYFSVTETRADLQLACDAHGFSLDEISICDLTPIGESVVTQAEASVFHPADTELGDIVRSVVSEVERVRPSFVVFDGLSELRLLAGDALRYRRQLLSLKTFFTERGITVLLLDDRSSLFGDSTPESLVGGSIVLDRFMPAYGKARRRVHVSKLRGSKFYEGFHDYEIVTGGVVVHPRLMTSREMSNLQSQNAPSGIENLDAMLDGGLTCGTTTILLGPAGGGKSTVAMQFVINALISGKRAAVYSFDEVLHTMIERSEKLCGRAEHGIRPFIESGQLHVQQVDPAELSPGAFAQEVHRAVGLGAELIVIDSLNGYFTAMPDERVLDTHLHDLFSYLNVKGITTIAICAQHGMMFGASLPRGFDVSYLADAVLLFRYFESHGEILQAINVVKKRTGAHERSIRQLRITAEGLSVGEPLREFRGIMTGVPIYDEAQADATGRRGSR